MSTTKPRIRKLVLSGVAAGLLLFGGPAAAQSNDYVQVTPPPPTPTPAPTAVPSTPSPSPTIPVLVEGIKVTDSQAALPLTGGDIAGMATIGIAAIAVGGVLIRGSRRDQDAG